MLNCQTYLFYDPSNFSLEQDSGILKEAAQSSYFGGFVKDIEKLVITGDIVNPYDIGVIYVALHLQFLDELGLLCWSYRTLLDDLKRIDGFVPLASRLNGCYCAR